MAASMNPDITQPAATLSVCENGPLIVRGNFELLHMADGQSIDPKRKVIALCRCGKSQIKPFCDGSHAYARRETSGSHSAAAVSHGGGGAAPD